MAKSLTTWRYLDQNGSAETKSAPGVLALEGGPIMKLVTAFALFGVKNPDAEKSEIIHTIPKPDAVIHVSCPPELAVQRQMERRTGYPASSRLPKTFRKAGVEDAPLEMQKNIHELFEWSAIRLAEHVPVFRIETGQEAVFRESLENTLKEFGITASTINKSTV